MKLHNTVLVMAVLLLEQILVSSSIEESLYKYVRNVRNSRELSLKTNNGDSDLGISSVGKRKSTKDSKSSKSDDVDDEDGKGKGKGEDNVFDHYDEDCTCERRQRHRRLGIGHRPPELTEAPCECSFGKGSKASKDSKSGDSGKGKDAGKHGDDDDDDGEDSDHPGPTYPPSHLSPTRPPNQTSPTKTPSDSQPHPDVSPTRTPSNNQPSSQGSQPTREPSIALNPTLAPLPQPSVGPSNPPPTGPRPSPTDGVPVEEPTTLPSEGGGNVPTPGGAPTSGGTPSQGGDGDTSEPTPGGAPTPGGTTPTPDGLPRCQLDGNGLFGSDVGISTEFAFTYQTLVIPSVTVGELNIDMLPRLERDMGNEIVARAFPQCSGDPAVSETLAQSLEFGGSAQQQQTQELQSGASDGPSPRYSTGTHSSFGSGMQRQLQSSSSDLSGFSSRPRDVVDEGVECTNVEPVFPCYVINGVVTVFSVTILDETTREMIRRIIQETIANGNLEESDNRFLDVTWDSHEPRNGGGNNNGNGEDVNGGDGGGIENDGGGGNPNGNNEEINRADPTGSGLQAWAYAIIAIGGVLFLIMPYFCFNPPRRKVDVGKDDDDDDDHRDDDHDDNDDDGSVEKNDDDNYNDEDASNDNKSESGESDSGHESVHDVYTEEVLDNDRATPLIANTSSSRRRASLDVPIPEESEDDLSYNILQHDARTGSRPSCGEQSYDPSQRSSASPIEYCLSGPNSNIDISESENSISKTEQENYRANLRSKEYQYDHENNHRYQSTMEETSDSSYGEEYEIEYMEDPPNCDDPGGHWADEHQDDDNEETAPLTDASMQKTAHGADALSRKSSFDKMRSEWEIS